MTEKFKDRVKGIKNLQITIEPVIIKKYDDVTPQEWSEYMWIRVDSFSDEYVRGAKKTQPPDDGYEYVDVTALGDAEQNWVRGKMKESEN